MPENSNVLTLDAVNFSGGSSGDCVIEFPEASIKQRRTDLGAVHFTYSTDCGDIMLFVIDVPVLDFPYEDVRACAAPRLY